MPLTSALADYISEATANGRGLNAGFVGYLAALEQVYAVSPEIAAAIVNELADQSKSLKMIASENYSSIAVQMAMGNLFTDKYAEGYPEHRFYAGCENVDAVEGRAASIAARLFGAEHAYVQPHSGADANMVAYWAILAARVQAPFMDEIGQSDPSKMSDADWADLRAALGNQRLLGMNYYSGGHLTHGYRHNASATMFDARSYDVNRGTNVIDYDDVRRQAAAFRPLILLAGYSAYPRKIDFRAFREIADETGAALMVDMAHFAGLVAGKVDGFTGDYDPVAHADVVTTTTHKTLRGPRGGMVLSTGEFGPYVEKGCPMVQGGPMPHVMAAKAVALEEASTGRVPGVCERHRAECVRARGGVHGRGYGYPDAGDGQSPDAGERRGVRVDRQAGGVRPARGERYAQPQQHPIRSERRMVHLRTPLRHACPDEPRDGDAGDARDRVGHGVRLGRPPSRGRSPRVGRPGSQAGRAP